MLRKKFTAFSILILLYISFSVSYTHAALPTVNDGDIIAYGYRLVVDGEKIEEYTQDNPVKIVFSTENIRPPGLYKAMKGMKLDESKDIVVPPEEGFTEDDWEYANLVGKTLYYYNVHIFSINGKDISEIKTNSGLENFGYYFLRISLGLIGAAAFILLIYFGYKIYPRFFGKRCVVCHKLAVGKCSKCGRTFCKACYSNGCPYCKGRKLILFKKG